MHDEDAVRFAEVFYQGLSAGRSVAHATAEGRRTLLGEHFREPARGQHWHLARVYLGPRGGGALCSAGRPARPFRRTAGYREFLDQKGERVPVATAAEFVGRRRQAQRVLRAFRDREGAGVLIHGIGGQGKSSLAARIANRMPRHKTVVVFGRYDALAIFEQVMKALPPRVVADFEAAWREPVTRDEKALRPALVDLLEGPFRAADPATKAAPILLIIDDLEKALEDPKPGEMATPVKRAYGPAIAAVIAAFRDAGQTDSRLLFTSRYTFALADERRDDLAARVVPVQLPAMDETQRERQMRASARPAALGGVATIAAGDRARLEARIKCAAGGNPGLQAALFRPLVAGEIDAATRAVAAVESYLATGEAPAEASAATEFFTRVSFKAFSAMLTSAETTWPGAPASRSSALFPRACPRSPSLGSLTPISHPS